MSFGAPYSPKATRRNAALFIPRTSLTLHVLRECLARPCALLASFSARIHLVPVMENASVIYIIRNGTERCVGKKLLLCRI